MGSADCDEILVPPTVRNFALESLRTATLPRHDDSGQERMLRRLLKMAIEEVDERTRERDALAKRVAELEAR